MIEQPSSTYGLVALLGALLLLLVSVLAGVWMLALPALLLLVAAAIWL